MPGCTHLDHVHITELPESVDGCEDCLRHGRRLAAPAHLPGVRARRLLRRLAQSPRQRPQRLQRSPDLRSIEPHEDWSWCFVDELMMRIPEVQGEPRIPPSPLGG